MVQHYVVLLRAKRKRETMVFTQSTAMRHKRGGRSEVTVTSGRHAQKDKEEREGGFYRKYRDAT